MINHQAISQDNPKVVPFKTNQNLKLINSSDKEQENTEEDNLVIPAFIVGQLFILIIASFIGLLFVTTNLIVKLVINYRRKKRIQSNFYEQVKDLMMTESIKYSSSTI